MGCSRLCCLRRRCASPQGQPLSKIEQDTDRDRYMSPLEAKEYGVIDHIIGGEEAVFNVRGSTKKFPKVSDQEGPWNAVVGAATHPAHPCAAARSLVSGQVARCCWRRSRTST